MKRESAGRLVGGLCALALLAMTLFISGAALSEETSSKDILKVLSDNGCTGCHSGSPAADGAPALDLTNENGLAAAAELGTLRQWIRSNDTYTQAKFGNMGGTNAPKLEPADTDLVTRWVDRYNASKSMAYDPVLRAVKTENAPQVDGKATEAAWGDAPAHLIKLTPTIYTKTDWLSLKAVYTESDLYILAVWPDSTLSMTRGGAWEWVGKWQTIPAASENDKQSEDRLSFVWNMTVPEFETVRGCAVKCHDNTVIAAYTDNPGEMLDMWHAKANRSQGAQMAYQSGDIVVDAASHQVTSGTVTMVGWIDDQVTKWVGSPGYTPDEDGGRMSDKGNSTYTNNRGKNKNTPLYMETTPLDYIDAMILTEAEIASGEAIVVDPSDPKYAGGEAIAAAWKLYKQFAAVVPERILRPATQGRADVTSGATWSNGLWQMEIKRALVTNDADDIQFDLAKRRDYEFSVAVFDNCGRGEIPPGHNTFGEGQYQILRFE